MKRGKIFYGLPDTGKFRLAKDIACTKNAVILDGRSHRFYENSFAFQMVTKDTDLIVVRDVPKSKLNAVLEVFSAGKQIVNRKYYKPFVIDTPEVIITTNCDDSDVSPVLIKARFDLLKFETSEDYLIHHNKLIGNEYSEKKET